MSRSKTLPLLTAALAAVALLSLRAQAAPPPIRESIEWCDIWVPHADETKLPRVLLIGDSITRGYYPQVEKNLAGKAYVARLTTSRSIADPVLYAELAMVLDQYPWDVVHFNNGMHGWGYTEEQYGREFPRFLAAIRKHAPHAKLIWCSTTDVRTSGKLEQVDPRTDRVRERNRLAAAIVERERIPVDDLFSLVAAHPEYHGGDGVHFNGAGTTVEGDQVAKIVAEQLR